MNPIKAYPLGISWTLIISTIIIDTIGSNRAARDGSKDYGNKFDIIAYDKNIPQPKNMHIKKNILK